MMTNSTDDRLACLGERIARFIQERAVIQDHLNMMEKELEAQKAAFLDALVQR